VTEVFEQQYDDQMTAEIRRLEAKQRATAVGHPEWSNACLGCGCELTADSERCTGCAAKNENR
jgi:hypothetical protein